MKWASLDFELSIPSNFLLFSFSFNLPQLLLPFYFHEVSGNTAYSANKEMVSTDESYFPTGYEPKAYYLMETDVESYQKLKTMGKKEKIRNFDYETLPGMGKWKQEQW